MSQTPHTLAELFNIPVPDRYECRDAGGYQGKTYPARQPTQVEQGYFSLWLEQEAAAWVERQTHLPAAALKAHRDGVRADAAAGRFHFYSEAAVARLNTLDGAARLLSICLLADGHAEADHDFCRRMLAAEAEAVAGQVARLAEDGDPKARKALEIFRGLMSTPTGSRGSKPTTSTNSSARRSGGRKTKSRG